MTRRSDLMLEDITGCTHEPETPIVEDGVIVEWRCRCGQRTPARVVARPISALEDRTCHRCGVHGGMGPGGCIACGASERSV